MSDNGGGSLWRKPNQRGWEGSAPRRPRPADAATAAWAATTDFCAALDEVLADVQNAPDRSGVDVPPWNSRKAAHVDARYRRGTETPDRHPTGETP